MAGTAFEVTFERQSEFKEFVVGRIQSCADPATGRSQAEVFVETTEPNAAEAEAVGTDARRDPDETRCQRAVILPLIEERDQRQSAERNVALLSQCSLHAIADHGERAWTALGNQRVTMADLMPPRCHSVGGR